MNRPRTILALCVIATSCAPRRADIEKAATYLRRFPYRYTGRHAPPQTPAQRALQQEATSFIAAHPRATLEGARRAIRDSPKAAAKVCSFLAFHKSAHFEPVFLGQLARPGFPDLHYYHATGVIGFLGWARSRRAVPKLIEVGKHERLREHVIKALAQIGDPRAVPFLSEVLIAGDHWRARKAARALAAIRHRSALPPLCSLVGDRQADIDVRDAAAWALVELGDRRAVPVLKEAARTPSRPNEASRFLWPLINLAPEEAVANVKAYGRPYMAKYLEPEDALPWMLEVFQNGDNRSDRGWAARELALLGERRIIPALKDELLFPRKSSNPREFLRALLELDDPEAGDFALWLSEVYERQLDPETTKHLPRDVLPQFRRRFDEKQDAVAFRVIAEHGDASDKNRVLAYYRKVKGRRPSMAGYADLIPILRFLTRVKAREALPLARKWVEAESSQWRADAIRTLGLLGEAEDAKLLLELVRGHRRYGYGWDALDAIAAIGDPGVAPRLRVMLKSRDARKRTLAAYGLARLGADDGKSYLAQVLSTAPQPHAGAAYGEVQSTFEAIERLGDRSYADALRSFVSRCQVDYFRLEGITVLASLGDEKGLRLALRALKGDIDEYRKQRLIEAIATGGHATRESRRLLERFALTAPVRLRKAALKALATVGDRSTLRLLPRYPIGQRKDVIEELRQARAALEAKYPTRRRASSAMEAARAARTHFDRPLAPKAHLVRKYMAICGQLRDHSRSLGPEHTDVLRALRQIADPRSVPILIDALKNPRLRCEYPAVPFWALQGSKPHIITDALARIGRPAVGPLLDVYKDGSDVQRKWALRALSVIDDERAVKILVEATKDWRVRHTAIKALGARKNPAFVPVLEATLSDKEWMTNNSIIDALQRIDGRAARDALIRMLRHKHYMTRSKAAVALGELRDEKAIPLLKALLSDPHTCGAAFRAARYFSGPAASDLMIHALFSNTRFVRAKAAKALGEIGDRRAVPYLIRALGTRLWFEERLDRAARQSLEKLTGKKFALYADWHKWYKDNPDFLREKR